MPEGNENGALSKRAIHEIYLGCILVAAIIALAAVQWYKIERLVELVSFALTISSLVLAIIAIGYSIYSGTGIERSVGNLLAAVHSIRSSTTDIDALRTALSADIRALADSVGIVATTVTNQSDVLTKLAVDREATQAPASVPVEPVIADQPILTFREIQDRGSLLGGYALLAVARCKERRVEINLFEAVEGTSLDANYMHGYIIALFATKVVFVQTSGGLIKSVEGPFDEKASDIKAYLVSRIETMDITEPNKKRFHEELLLFDERLKGVAVPKSVEAPKT